MLLFFVSKGQEATVTKKEHDLVKVYKSESKVDMVFTPVSYLKKDVAFGVEEKLTLSPIDYSKLVTQLQNSLKNREDQFLQIGDYQINIDFFNSFCIYSKTPLGTRFFDYQECVRFSVNGMEHSVFLSRKDLEKIRV